MKKFFVLVVFCLVAINAWGATQDFKGTINGNTITSGTGTLTLGTSTLTVSGSLTISETPTTNANLQAVAKAQVIAGIYQITTPANIKGLWIFDQTGAVSTINDRSGNAHTVTLRDNVLSAINASTLSPAITGLMPNLTFSTSALWNTPDHNDFSFSAAAFSIVALINPTDMTSSTIISKTDETTGLNQLEYEYYFDAADKLNLLLWDQSETAYLLRSYNTALTANEGSWGTYIATFDGGVSSDNIKLYVNGSQVGDTSAPGGVFVAMENKSALVGNYKLDSGGATTIRGKYKSGLILIVGEELTAAQVRQLDYLLRGYAGDSLN